MKRGIWYLEESGKLIIVIIIIIVIATFAFLARDKLIVASTEFFQGGFFS